ncbi:MAG: DUF3299 domain-containing protein [Planctomycetota bacterium]|jgi:hypothetical protein
MRGFTQPLAVAVGVLVCVVIGYAIMSGFSYQSNANAAQIQVEQGALLDSPVGLAPSQETPTDEVERPQLPDVDTLGKPLQPEELAGGYIQLTFAKISNYRYIYPEPDDPNPPKDQIPESILKLNGQKIAIRGFMMPVTQKEGRVTEFLLMKDQSACCFGVWPGMNEWIHVLMEEGQSAPMVWDIPTMVFGEFEVGEVYEKGILMSIYRMKFHKLIEPEREPPR